MCVIMIVSKDGPRPTQSMMEKAWGRNDDGAGIAWRERDSKGVPIVKWKKGLGAEEMEDLCNTVPAPYVAHWRIASCGGVREELTHPFPIQRDATLALEGKTKGYVLFHNGTWPGWDDAARYAAMQKSLQIPTGKWSDSRAMAWLMSVYGNGFMELLPAQRGVAFGPTKMDIFTGPGWSQVNGIWCSNDFFVNFSTKATPSNADYLKPMCHYYKCTRRDLDNDKRCPEHPKTSFPTNGYEAVAAKAPGVSSASPLPFPQGALSIAVAEMLHRRIDGNGQRILSKSKLNKIKKFYEQMKLGGNRAERAQKALTAISAPFQTLPGQRP